MEAINFYIIHMAFLMTAEFIWASFVFFIGLKILRKNDLLFTKNFYYFIFASALTSFIINRLFDYGVQDTPIVSEIWAKIGSMERLGIIIVPTFILMYFYFYFSTSILKLSAKQSLFLALLLGVATAPWRILV